MANCNKVKELRSDYEKLKRNFVIMSEIEKKRELLKLKNRAKQILFSDECIVCKEEVRKITFDFCLS